MPRPCHPRPCRWSQGHGIVTACGWPARALLLPATTRSSTKFIGVPRSLSEAYQFQMQVASVTPDNVCHERRNAYYFGARTWMLYNLQHKDYDRNLVKDNCWKEIAGEVQSQDKEQATQYFVHYRKAYWWYAFVWYYSDNVMALFISVEECKSTWTRLRSYYRKALRRRESTSGQAARKVKKWRFEEQMRFLQNHY